jgi:hypothetical protein
MTKTHNNTINDTRIHNPCYLKGYSNNASNILGVGDYDSCYDLLHNLVFKNTPMKEQKNEGIVI